jgi:hypothetical protein
MRHFATDTSWGFTSAGVLLSAVVHLDLWGQGFRAIPLLSRSVRERTA